MKKWKSELDLNEDSLVGLKDEKLRLTSELDNKTREISSLQRQLDGSLKERQNLKELLQVIYNIFELQLISQTKDTQLQTTQQEFRALSQEQDLLQQDLTQVFQERERFKKELEECEKQIEHLEHVMKETDQERHQSMISYRKLIIEHERLDMLYKRSEESAGALRMEVMMRDKAIQGLQDTVSEANSEIMKLKGTLHASEKQVGSMCSLF